MYRPEIDGLRALAVVAVIANHFGQGAPASGHLGVDIFFVISGYVITAALASRRGAPLGEFLLSFYARRIKRLAPALVLSVLVGGLALCLVDPAPRRSLETGISALFGLSNLYLLSQASDYFSPPAQLNAFLHTWSLGVEEQFYFVFPLMLWVLGAPRSTGALRSPAVVVALLTLASLSAFAILHSSDPTAAFYLMPTRFWELGAGAFLFLGVPQERAAALATVPLGSAALSGLVLCLFLPPDWPLPTLLAVVGLTSVVILAARPGTATFALLSHRAVVYVGRISYSLYLWHWVVIVLSRWTIGIDESTLWIQAIAIAGLAVASFHLVENPLRGARWTRSSGRTVAAGISALLVAACGLAVATDGRLYTGATPHMVATGTGSLTAEYPAPDGVSLWRGAPCIVAGDADIGKRIRVQDCTLGDPARAGRRVLVLGDSFAAAFVRGFDGLVRSRRYAVTIVSSWGASPAPGVANRGDWARSNAYFWNTVANEQLASLRAGDVVLLASDLAGYSPFVQNAASASELGKLQASLEAFADRLHVKGIALVVLHANPPAREANCEPAAAIPQWFKPGIPCSFITRADALRRRAALDSMLAGLHRRGKLGVLDLISVFCPGARCSYQAPHGHPLYRDAHSHPSVEAMLLSEKSIRRAIEASEAKAGQNWQRAAQRPNGRHQRAAVPASD